MSLASWGCMAYGVPARSLHAFRVATACLVLYDLFWRSHEMSLLADSGPLPRSAAPVPLGQLWLLPYHWLPTAHVAILCHSLVAVSFGVGLVDTRGPGLLLALFHRSALMRNIHATNFGDKMFQSILVCSSFTDLSDKALQAAAGGPIWAPLNGRLQALHSQQKAKVDRLQHTVFTLTGTAVCMQMAALYLITGVLKTAPMWGASDGSAVFYFLSERRRVYPLGRLLVNMPWVCYLMTVATKYVAEGLAPLAMLSPSPRVRTLGVVTELAFNIGLSNCARLVYFQWQCNVALIACLPLPFWEMAESLWEVFACHIRQLVPRAWQRACSLGVCWRRAPSPWAQVLSYRREEPCGGVLDAMRVAWRVFALCYICLCLAGASYSICGKTTSKQPQWIRAVASATRLPVHQTWAMFAPSVPVKAQGWPIIIGTLANGTQVDLLRWVQMPERLKDPLVAEPLSLQRPSSSAFDSRTVSRRWVMYLNYLENKAEQNRASLLGRYICKRWRQQELTELPGQTAPPSRLVLRAVQPVFMKQRALPPVYSAPWVWQEERYQVPELTPAAIAFCQQTEPHFSHRLPPRRFKLCGVLLPPGQPASASYNGTELLIDKHGGISGTVRRRYIAAHGSVQETVKMPVSGRWTSQKGQISLSGEHVHWEGVLNWGTGEAVVRNQFGNLVLLQMCP